MKKNKINKIYIFPLIFILFPLFYFLFLSFIRYINTDVFNYINNFSYFYISIKSIKEYLLPAVIFLTFGLILVLINKFAYKKIIKFKLWILIIFIGNIIVLLGNRIIFITINNLWQKNIFSFLINGIDPYTFLLSFQIVIFICFILHYFDIKYLRK